MARALPQALSVDTAEESSVSLVSDSVSVDSTVTLENLPFKPSRLLTPPWSTETSREGVAEDEGGGGGGGGLEPDRSESPGWSETQSVGLALDWARVPYWDSTRSAPGAWPRILQHSPIYTSSSLSPLSWRTLDPNFV